MMLAYLCLIKNMNKLDNKLKNKIRCPVCNQTYSLSSLTKLTDSVFSREELKQRVFYLSCQRCLSSSVIFVAENKEGVLIAGTNTDLSLDEIYHFSQKETISNEDTIAVYKFFNNKKNKSNK